jgi:hypothetical protein
MIWNNTQDLLPKEGQKVYYFYQWIGMHTGTYKGNLFDRFCNESYPTFQGDGGTWQADNDETFWCEWIREQPEPPEGYSPEEMQEVIDKMNEKTQIENAPKFDDFDSIANFLGRIKSGEIPPRKGAQYLLETFDEAWEDGLKFGRRDYRDQLIKLSELEHANKLREFVELTATPKRPDGTYNYCREALEQKAKELL